MASARILIVEDEAIIAMSLRDSLERFGYEVAGIAGSGEEAMRMASETGPDLILMDIMIRGDRDGIETARDLRARFDIPFIYVSAYADRRTVERARDTEPYGYLNKPVSDRDLYSNIDAALLRHRLERKLRESEERYRLVVENINDVLFTQDENGIITYISPVIERISRYKAEEIIGQAFTRFIDPGDLPALMESYARTVAGSTEPLEFRLRDKDGAVRHVRTSSRIVSKNGVFAGLTGILTDITDRMQAESQREAALEALEESRRSLLTLMGNLPGIAYRCRNDRQRTMELISEGCYELTGYAPEDLTLNRSLSFNDLIHPEDREFVREEIESHIKRKAPYQIAYRITTARGEVRWVWEKGSGVYGKTGDLIALEGFITDITDRKTAEENIRLSNDKLLKTLSGIIQSMEMTLEVRDPYTAGHQRRVAHLARAIAMEMKLSENEVEGIHIASTIHDLGKIQVPIEILSKPTRLTELEFNMIKNHSWVGYEILKTIDFPWPVAEIVYQHHERLDGTGYPRGLKGDDVILEARILMVADVVEAVASHRPYRPALGIDIALEEIRKGRGSQYDGTAVGACLRLFLEKGFELE